MDPALLKRTLSTIALASALPGSTLAGGLLGAWLDDRFGSSPFGVVSLGALGFAAAVVQLLRTSRTPDDPAPPPPS